ncbi:MAG: winged helix-turn-helix transcriptional regulator [Lachnospiraceae bacterium]|jgi:DNA-binding MarR family transcriptional regulator|nr:winged helix-turn-helix transcriptional regulator [Lachnospiraceae bacterium]MCI9283470.1 winged helix-turn-helix transcriptional regulator [Lachnospiraceae bacterium]
MNCNFSKAMKRFNHLLSEIDATYHEMSLKLGLSDSAMIILYTICDNDDKNSCLLQDICHRSGLSKQTINSSLRQLESKGILYLEAITPKSKNVCLTDRGKQLANQTAGRVIQAENEIFASWPQEDVEKYLALTESFLLALRDKAKNL